LKGIEFDRYMLIKTGMRRQNPKVIAKYLFTRHISNRPTSKRKINKIATISFEKEKAENVANGILQKPKPQLNVRVEKY
jgi:hypothetical protein